MKKQALLLISGVLLSLCMLFTGCGEGEGAEDTGEDGKVANGKRTTTSTTDNADLLGDKDTDILEGDDTRTTGNADGRMMDDDMLIG